jgi:hypothetical protein
LAVLPVPEMPAEDKAFKRAQAAKKVAKKAAAKKKAAPSKPR